MPKFIFQSIKMVPASSVSFNPSLSVTWKGKISALLKRFQSKPNANMHAITVLNIHLEVVRIARMKTHCLLALVMYMVKY